MKRNHSENSFDAFSAAVRSSCQEHAKRKNYNVSGDVDGPNQLAMVSKALNIHNEHGIGEIIYKAAEYLKGPRRVLLEKIAGWAFIIWRDCPPDRGAK